VFTIYAKSRPGSSYSGKTTPGVSLRVPLRSACHILNQPATAKSKSAERAVKRDVTHILGYKR